MWPKRAHFLAPLIDMCSTKRKFFWNGTHEHSFQQIKRLVAEDVMLRFLDHNQSFSIYTDVSNNQIGATIKQKILPIAYFSRKLSPTQRRYPTIEQEMLAIVKVLKDYRNFLLGSKITIFTDHKNLLSQASDNNRVLRWKKKIEEYNATFVYFKEQNNHEADVISRLPMTEHEDSLEIMLNHPPMDAYNPLLNKYPHNLNLINKYPRLDPALLKAAQEYSIFVLSIIFGTKLIQYQPLRSECKCIVIPVQL